MLDYLGPTHAFLGAVGTLRINTERRPGFGDSSSRVNGGVGAYLGAHGGAVHDGVAPVQLVGVVYLLEPLLGGLVAGVNDPPAQQQPLDPTYSSTVEPLYTGHQLHSRYRPV